MARTRSITNEQILEAARAVFIEHGIEAPTSEIARRAGISEGTIFKRFGTKHGLFAAAMQLPQEPAWVADLEGRVGQGSLREQMERMALQMLEFFEELIPKLQMVMSHNMDMRAQLLQNPDAPPVRALKRLAYFFDQEQRLGRLGRCDSEILARALVGAMHHYAFAERCGINELIPMPQHTYARGVVSMLLGPLIVEDLSEEGDESSPSSGVDS